MSSTVQTATDIREFHVDVPEDQLGDLRRRIEATRWPTKELVDDRSQGVQLVTVKELARYWVTDYDWRKAEAKLNALPQFTTKIDGVDIHFIHVKSQHENALPLIMTHGWPGSVVELIDSVGPLTDPTAHERRNRQGTRLARPREARLQQPRPNRLARPRRRAGVTESPGVRAAQRPLWRSTQQQAAGGTP